MLAVQMIHLRPAQMIWIGLILLVLGVILPLFMVIKILPSSILLGMFSYTLSVIGMFVGTIGAFTYVKEKRK